MSRQKFALPILFRAHFPGLDALVYVGADQATPHDRPVVHEMPGRTDAELVEAARNGDVSSFGELYRRYYAAAVGIAYCWVPDRHLAEDAAQEAFAIACRDLGRLRRADKFAGWLKAICRKVARRFAKSKPRHELAGRSRLVGSRGPRR